MSLPHSFTAIELKQHTIDIRSPVKESTKINNPIPIITALFKSLITYKVHWFTQESCRFESERIKSLLIGKYPGRGINKFKKLDTVSQLCCLREVIKANKSKEGPVDFLVADLEQEVVYLNPKVTPSEFSKLFLFYFAL